MAVDAGTIYSEVRIQVNKLSGDIKNIETKLDQFAAKNKSQSTKVKNSWSNSFKQVNLAGIAAFAAIGIAVKKAISTFADYQQSMANVRSVTAASAEDFKRLENAAIEAGETTRFTASQAADALYYLASAGLDATQSINALQGVLELAGATGSDLAFTSATMAATLSQFSLDASESTRVANVFASAISNSQANMEKLASALKQVGPISGALDISLEETTAALEALYNAGFAGEQAGTGLRNILLDLSDSGGPVIKQLEALGIAFDEVNPREVGLINAIDVLAKSGIDLGNVFGKRVAAQVLTLAKTGGDALRELQDEITDTNAAAEMYAIQNDTLAGSMDFLNSAMESASIKLIEEIEPALRGLIDTLTKAVQAFNAMPGPLKVITATLAIAGPTIAGVTSAVNFLSGAFTGLAGAMLAVGGIFAITGIIQGMLAAAQETENINMVLENAVRHGEDLNATMVKLSKDTGIPLENIKEIALKNETINGVLLEQKKIHDDIIAKYKERVTELGTELELNYELLASQSPFAKAYQERVDLYLELLEAQRESIRLAQEEAALEEQAEEDARRRAEEIAALENELRLANLSDMERAFDEIEQKHQEYLAAGLDDEEWYQREVAAIIEKYADKSTPDTEEQKQSYEDLSGTIDDYRAKLERLNATKLESIELDKQAAIEAIQESDATVQAKHEAIQAVLEYYEALKDNTANEIFKENFKKTTETILSGFSGLMGAIADLYSSLIQNQLDDLDEWLQRELEAQGLVEETTLERLQRELEEAIEAGDLELAEQLRQDIERERLQEEYERRKAQIEYEGELKAWKFTLAAGIANAALAVLAGFSQRPFLPVGLAAGLLATAKSAIEVAAIKSQKPEPPQLATGGLVIPTNPNGTQVNVAENGSSELLLNGGAEGQALLDDFARRVASQSGGSGTLTIILNMDGKRVAESSANYYNNGIVRVKL